MPQDQLEPDEDARKVWENMPKNTPSKDALPPVTGGFPGWLWILIGLAVVIFVIGLLQMIF